MFSLPTPYASTPEGRNEVRDEQVVEALTSARNLLQDMVADLTTLIDGVQDPALWKESSITGVDAGLVYGRASFVSRDVMAVKHRLRDFDDSTARAMIIAASYEISEA